MKLCSRNHPQTPENTKTRTHSRTGQSYVSCRLCEVERGRAWAAANPGRNKRPVVTERKPPKPPKPHPEWPASRIEQLTALWAEGLSTQKIADRLGTTKSSVVGKAHRLNLPPRPSPIQRGAPKAPAQPHSAARAAAAAGVIAGLVSGLPAPVMAMPRGPSDRVRTSVRTTQPVPEAPRLARGPCCWLDGERGAYRRCDSPAVRGSYCERHGSLAYQPKQPSREMSHAV